jgi:signal transduction histidine kinase/DNA-binding response OmpR family regulator
MCVEGHVIGLVNLDSVTPDAFNETNLYRLQAFANQAATAFQNAQVYQELQTNSALLEQTRDQALEASQLKSQFLANMSHELRTPLNSIIGFGQILVDGLVGALNDQQQEFTNDMLNSAQHLLGLINDVLDMSKIEAGQMRLQPERFDFSQLARETADTVRSLVAKKEQQLVLDIAADLPALHADRVRIKQVLLNLFSNAHKFTPQHGRITLHAERSEESTVLISVTDTGIGIAPEDLQFVFQEFQQIDNSMTRSSGGTGLGLPITRKLVQMHGGVIWVESEAGKGTTFSLLLPLDGVGETVNAPALPVSYKRPAESSKISAHPLILVVEDDPRFSNILAFHFGREGYNVVQHYSGAGVVEQARQIRPSLITLDIMLPDLDGWEVLRQLKSDPDTADIRVVVISAVDNMHIGLELGAVDYLVKPLDPEHLDKLLKTVRTATADAPTRVLVVDDNADIGQLIQKTFPQPEFSVQAMTESQQALEHAISAPPDVLILDLMMPDLNGFQFLERFRSEHSTHNIPVLILTALDLTGAQESQLSANVEGIFYKSSSRVIRQLLEEIRRLCTHPIEAGVT